MAAGQGFKTFTTGEVLTAADVNGYLMQGVLVFASEAARNAAITSPQEGQFAYTKDNNSLWYYTGSAWAASGATGDIEGVTAGVGISGGGTSGTVTITNSMATEISAKGDLVVGTGSQTFDNLTVGANNTILTADSSTATGLKWATATSAATSYTLLNTGGTSLTGSSVTISSLGGYNKLFVIIDNFSCANPTDIFIRINADSGSNYRAAGFGYAGQESTVAAGFGLGYNGNLADKLSLGTFYGTTQAGGATVMIDGANGSGLKTYQVSVGGNPSAYNYPVMQGVWSGSAITSLVFHSLTQNWDAGTVRVYGA